MFFFMQMTLSVDGQSIFQRNKTYRSVPGRLTSIGYDRIKNCMSCPKCLSKLCADGKKY